MTVTHALFQKVHLYGYICFGIIWIINRHSFSRCHVPPGYTASHSIRPQFSCFIAMMTQNCNNQIHEKNITFNRTHVGDTITPSSIFSRDSCKINILMYEVSQYWNYSNSFLINTFFSHWFWRVSYHKQCCIKWWCWWSLPSFGMWLYDKYCKRGLWGFWDSHEDHYSLGCAPVWYKSTQVREGDAALLGFFQQWFLLQQKWHRISGIFLSYFSEEECM